MLNEDILERIINMIKSININLELIQEIKNDALNKKNISVNLNPTQWLKEENNKLANIYNQENLKNSSDYKNLGFIINKINSFVNNFKIDDPDLDKKIIEIQNTNKELLKKLKPTIYDYYFENLRKVAIMLDKLAREEFLANEIIDINQLNKYNKALNEYYKLLEQFEAITFEIDKLDEINLNELLEKNYQKLNNNFKTILLNMLDNDPVFFVDLNKYSKVKKLIDNENYDYILNKNIINSEISSKDIRSKLNESFKNLVSELYEIYDTYKDKKFDRSKLDIDIILNDEPNTNKDYNIDIPTFVNEAYDKKRTEMLNNFQSKADNLEQEYSKDGNLTIGRLKTLKELREKIRKEKEAQKPLISKFQFWKKVRKGRIQKKNPYQRIQDNKGKHFK